MYYKKLIKSKKLISVIIYIFLIVFLTTCDIISSNENRKKFNLGDTIEVYYKDTVFNDQENIWITFDSLLSDSRCPIGSYCFGPGYAKGSFTFKSKDTNRFSLESNIRLGGADTDTTINNYLIFLVKIEPFPKDSDATNNYDYINRTYNSRQDNIELDKFSAFITIMNQ